MGGLGFNPLASLQPPPEQVPMTSSEIPNQVSYTNIGDATNGGASSLTNGTAADLQPPAATAPVVGPPAVSQNAPSQDDINNWIARQASNQRQNYLSDQIQREQQALSAEDPSSNRGGPLKRMVMSFLRGGGDAMRRDVGLPTVEQQNQQHVQNLIALSNAQTMEGLRDAQTQALQLVPRTLPDGSQVMIPQGHVATFDAAMIRNQNPGNLNDQIGRAIGNAIQAGRDPNTDPNVQQLMSLYKQTQKPPADTAALQKENFMTGIQPAIAAGEITSAMMTDVKQLVAGIQGSKAIPQAQKPALVSYLLANNTPASQGTQAQVKVNLDSTSKTTPVYDTLNKNSLMYLTPEAINAGNAAQPGRYTQAGQIASGAKTGYAFNPATNETVLTNPQETAQRGFTAFRPVGESDIRKDTHDIKILNDIAVKSNNVISAAAALDQKDPTQRSAIAQAISAADKDEQFRIGAFGTQIPTAWLNNLLNSNVMVGASQQTKDYVVALLSLREAAMGMQRLLTGTARNSESQIAALQATLPGLEPNSQLARQKMAAFTQNLSMLRQGLPTLPGISSVPLNNESQPTGNQVSPELQRYLTPMGSQTYTYDPKTDSLQPQNTPWILRRNETLSNIFGR